MKRTEMGPIGGTVVNELCECKNLAAPKNCVGSFSSNFQDNIDRTWKKVGMIFSS